MYEIDYAAEEAKLREMGLEGEQLEKVLAHTIESTIKAHEAARQAAVAERAAGQASMTGPAVSLGDVLEARENVMTNAWLGWAHRTFDGYKPDGMGSLVRVSGPASATLEANTSVPGEVTGGYTPLT